MFILNIGRQWETVHIDDVRPPQSNRPEISSLVKLKGDFQSIFAHPGEVNSERLILDSLHCAVSRIDAQSSEDSEARMKISKRISSVRSQIEGGTSDGT